VSESAQSPVTAAGSTIQVTLPDGKSLTLPRGSTLADVAKAIGPRLAKDAIAGKVDGRLVDLAKRLDADCAVQIVTPNAGEEALEILRHSTSHALAQAVKELWPETKIAQGPSIENGFYYDFDREDPFTEDDLRTIERRMAEIVARDLKIERLEMPKADAVRYFESENEPYKTYFAREKGGDIVSAYRQEGFTDFCRGPHVPSTGKLRAFKLLNAAGAYWLGSENNRMLQRIYGTAFFSDKELAEHLERLEEAKRRDHRKLGKELDLFSFHPEAPAMPFFHPKGAIVYNLLVDFVRELYRRYGYQEVITPQIFDAVLWKRSGHYDNYKENMFFLEADEREYAVKPMNCPSHCLIYRSGRHSYRELPLRLADFGRLHRYERSGVTAGLTRVRSFAQDDAHIFLAPEMIRDEVGRFIAMLLESYGLFGLTDVRMRLGTRPENSIGSPELWLQAEKGLSDALQASGMAFELEAGEGAFYGPKIDVMVNDALKREWQLGTVQLDFNNPERFDLHYVTASGENARPVMIHRAMLGSIERFMGILIEHCAGAFPFWLAPVQVRVLPITDRVSPRAQELLEILRAAGLRAEADLRSEKIGHKIREAQLEKVPFMLVLGDREAESGQISVRSRSRGDLGVSSVESFVGMARDLVASRSRDN
jgi:threonyl-tRNA synthetase